MKNFIYILLFFGTFMSFKAQEKPNFREMTPEQRREYIRQMSPEQRCRYHDGHQKFTSSCRKTRSF